MNNVEKLKSMPTYLYGAGELAELFLSECVKHNNTAIAGVVISKEYFQKDSFFYGHPIHPLEEVLNEKSEANVILCFLKDNYDDVIETLKKIAPNCNFLIPQEIFLQTLQSKILINNNESKDRALQELYILGCFLKKTPEFLIKAAADYIVERTKVNIEKIQNTEEKYLAPMFTAITDKIKCIYEKEFIVEKKKNIFETLQRH